MSAPRRVIIFLIVGLAAASQSGNIIRIGDAHPVAIAAWRLILAAAILAPFARRNLSLVAGLTRKEILMLGAAGVALAFHFFTWIAAVQMTTVANAAMAFAINPVITATAAAFFFGERASARILISIGLGLAGVAVIGWSDFSFCKEHLAGDLMAILCSVLFTVYFLFGKHLRTRLPTDAYVTVLYFVAAVCSFLVLVIIGEPIVAYSGRNWFCFVLMALIPTVLGHTSMNAAVKYVDAGRISTATLSEPLLAGVVAYFAWGEEMTWFALGGYGLICSSVVVLVLDGTRKRS